MGRQHGVRCAQEGMVGLDGLGLEDVDAGAPQASLFQRLGQRPRVDDRAARGVHHHGGGLHECDALLVEHVAGLGRQRAVEAHHVAYTQKFLVIKDVVALGGAAARLEGARPAHHLEAQPVCLLCHGAANLAHAHHAEGAPRALAQRPRACKVPHACLDVAVELVDAAQARQGQGYRVVGDDLGAVAGHVAHSHAVLGSRGDVDAVEAHAGAAHHAQVR